MWRIHRGVAPLLRDNAAEMSSYRQRSFEFWTEISTSRTHRSFSATEASLYVVYGELLSRSRKYLSREDSRSLRLADPFLRMIIGHNKNEGCCYGWRIGRFEIEVSLIVEKLFIKLKIEERIILKFILQKLSKLKKLG